ncbi:hypothetical protein [Mucilaginibacter arboris]|uniref:Uncharacterized protein n=1 Tax=Mucilaginibacter arboris TaxID=2682090 RepID=A0A7K1SXP7_9SPHI|nr:hypothetical protein [Mucilaginibacter arboris]MVN22095.1 hypothetical protein [Mucilaginibacter arboris]
MNETTGKNHQDTSAASEFDINTILIKELGINSAKVEMIFRMQVEILALLQDKTTEEILGEKNERIKELALEFYIANSKKM